MHVAWLLGGILASAPLALHAYMVTVPASCRSGRPVAFRVRGTSPSRAAHVELLSARQQRLLMMATKKDEDSDLAEELARRLADDDDDAPLRRKRVEPTSEQAQRNRFFTVPGQRSFSKESGEDYWMDERDAKSSRRPSSTSKSKRGQFSASKIRAEIISPYKNNWILLIMITVFSLVFFGFLFPEELVQIPSIRIPDVDFGAPTPFNIQ